MKMANFRVTMPYAEYRHMAVMQDRVAHLERLYWKAKEAGGTVSMEDIDGIMLFEESDYDMAFYGDHGAASPGICMAAGKGASLRGAAGGA